MRGKRLPLAVAFGVFLLFFAALVLRGRFAPPGIELPPVQETTDPQHGTPGGQNGVIDRIELNCETVQSAVESLARPERYSRTVTIERYYSGGSGVSMCQVQVIGGWTRLDQIDQTAEPRHVLTDGMTVYVWYGADTEYFSGSALFSADAEGSIPTYEDVLELDREQITAAEYTQLEGKNCIFVETMTDGVQERYWISVENGLLVASEKLVGGGIVYRMAAVDNPADAVDDAAFVLPDGTPLLPESSAEQTK